MTQQEMMEDSTQYCCYCGGEKVRFQCCRENHFQTFAQMPADERQEFLDNEECAPLYTSTQPQKPWVGLTDEEIWSVYTQVDSMQYMEFSHAIEAKLKEKNT